MPELFPQKWIDRQRSRWNGRGRGNPSPIQLLVDDPLRQPFRHWLQAEIDLLSPDAAEKVVPRIRSEENFLTTVNEIGTGALLRANGRQPQYEPELEEGVTPDWYVAPAPGQTGVVVEVVTRSNPTATARRAWQQLAAGIASVGSPWAVLLRSGSPIPGPDAAARKYVTTALEPWLAEPRSIGDTITLRGYTFEIFGPSPVDSTLFSPPAPEAGPVSYDALLKLLRKKKRAYGPACARLNIPLVVVIASDLMNGHDAGGFRSYVHSRQHTAEIIIDPTAVGPVLDVSFPLEERALPPLPPEVSDILFLRCTLEHLSWEPIGNPGATRPLPEGFFPPTRIALSSHRTS